MIKDFLYTFKAQRVFRNMLISDQLIIIYSGSKMSTLDSWFLTLDSNNG